MVSRDKILVVDDSPTILGSIRRLLEKENYDVLTTDKPFSVPKTVRESKPKLVLLDLNMPILPGDRIVEIIRSFSSPTETILILFSDLPERDLIGRVKFCKANEYFRKSKTQTDLVSYIRSWMEKL